MFVWNLQEEVVWADEEFLKEALSNLIDNALKYSGEAVEIIFLSERKADGTVCVTVADNGFGIPLKDQRKILKNTNGRQPVNAVVPVEHLVSDWD